MTIYSHRCGATHMRKHKKINQRARARVLMWRSEHGHGHGPRWSSAPVKIKGKPYISYYFVYA